MEGQIKVPGNPERYTCVVKSLYMGDHSMISDRQYLGVGSNHYSWETRSVYANQLIIPGRPDHYIWKVKSIYPGDQITIPMRSDTHQTRSLYITWEVRSPYPGDQTIILGRSDHQTRKVKSFNSIHQITIEERLKFIIPDRANHSWPI